MSNSKTDRVCNFGMVYVGSGLTPAIVLDHLSTPLLHGMLALAYPWMPVASTTASRLPGFEKK
jgi:hypothetical protein